MRRGLSRNLTRTRLRLLLLLLFGLLAAPTLVLLAQTLRQIRWESYHQYDALAGELALRIDAELQRLIAVEEARGYGDYGFLVADGSAGAGARLQRSELSQDEAHLALPGAIGWFQIDAGGEFSSPLLPDATMDPRDWGIDPSALAERRDLAERVRTILAGEQLANRPPPTDASASMAATNQLLARLTGSARTVGNSLGRIDQLQLDKRYQDINVDRKLSSEARLAEQRSKSKVALPEQRKDRAYEKAGSGQYEAVDPASGPDWLESEVDPMRFRQLDAAHAILYRRVWRDGGRGFQGVLIELPAFLQQTIVDVFRSSALASATDLVIALDDDVLRVISAAGESASKLDATDVKGELLHQVRLSAPFDDLQLLWSVHDLPAGPGTRLVAGAALALFAAMIFGLLAVYRLGLREIALASQQRDFVSAVSHELKTPLTSIRMYAEMLLAGWASEAKKLEYFGFIHDESERLTRLIGNVLQLARLEREELALQPRPVAVKTLLDLARSRIQAQIERAGFSIETEVAADCEDRLVQADPDAFVQILINLVDNALKFSAGSGVHRLEWRIRDAGRNRIAFSLRDHGPGIAAGQVQRVFEPFQRGGSELTREAPGTGIGLALARQLARAMGGDIVHRAADPGAEFSIVLQRAQASAAPMP